MNFNRIVFVARVLHVGQTRMDERRGITRAIVRHLPQGRRVLHFRQQVFELIFRLHIHAGNLFDGQPLNGLFGLDGNALEMPHVFQHDFERGLASR